jgi:hypothetical protein
MRTKYTLTTILVVLCLWSEYSLGQKRWFALDSTTALHVGGQRLENPWVGGLNASQFSKMDLNGDAVEDLIVFDRTSSKITTFLATKDSQGQFLFKHAPYFESRFPKIDNWMRLVDYDGDGLKDLFVSTSLGIKVYRQEKVGSSWSWVLASDAIYTKGFSRNINLQVSGSDIPAIVDIDGDGDLDILTFDFSGVYIELHQNMSMERFGSPDHLGSEQQPVYVRNGDCWGNFHKSENSGGFVLGADCNVVIHPDRKIMHAGNTILLEDMDGDGIKDLLVGHVSDNYISFLKNDSKSIIGNFIEVNQRFPAKDPAQFHIFLSAFMEDVDFDGVKDLLVSTNVPASDHFLSDFKSSNWLYKNTGSATNPQYALVRKNFLQDQMLDVGENASPVFMDMDGDGDLDILIGTGGMPSESAFRGTIWYLKNTGSSQNPAYTLESEDFMGLKEKLNGYNIRPQWADFNGDGVLDLGFSFISNKGLTYRYIPNTGKKGQPVALDLANMVPIDLPSDIQLTDAPYWHDGDRNGILDLLVGTAQGNLNYYLNTGTGIKPIFKLESSAFAGIGMNFEGRFLRVTVADVDMDGHADLITTDLRGKVQIYHSAPWGKWTEKESFLIDLAGNGHDRFFGQDLYISVADYNGDFKPDLVVGTNLGGITLVANKLPIVVTGVEPEVKPVFQAYPNPAQSFIYVQTTQDASFVVRNLQGNPVRKHQTIKAREIQELSVQDLPPGLYFIELQSKGGKEVKKIVLY